MHISRYIMLLTKITALMFSYAIDLFFANVLDKRVKLVPKMNFISVISGAASCCSLPSE